MAFEYELPNPQTENVKSNLGEGDLVRRSASSVPPPEKPVETVVPRSSVTVSPPGSALCSGPW